MTTKFRAQFDGKALIPLDPVDLPTGQILEIEAQEVEGLRRGSPELLLKVMRELPKLTKEDTDELERMIEEGKLPVRYDGIFDDLK
jgi:predicted DNA-binding antitoxin AbrB/MazE fold protein